MKIARNIKAISRLLLILLLLLAMIIGSIFSYLLLVGYYINLENRVPENTTLSVMDVNFDPQEAETFNITILNPTYSPTDANITEISVATEDDTVHSILSVDPQLPFQLDKGQDETFNCAWSWGDYAGENVKVIVLVEDGSGSAYEIETPSIRLFITGTIFATGDSQHFDITINNHDDSTIDLDLTRITVTMDNGTVFEISEVDPSLPHVLLPGDSQSFKCSWDWTYYRGRNATINVFTSQGYTAQRIETTPKPVQLSITDTNFDISNVTVFSITVKNDENSIVSANLALVELLFTDETTLEVPVESPPGLPYTLPIGDSVTFKCLWDWTSRRGENIAIEIKTPENYFGITQVTIP